MIPNKLSDQKAELLKITTFQRHIFFCAGPECCKSKTGDELWNHLKKRLGELGLSAPGNGIVFRSKVACLRICSEGPIAIVYPEAVWYRQIDLQSLDRIIDEHLQNGNPVKDLIWCRNFNAGKS